MGIWDKLDADAYIFDLDGTLVDSMPLHYSAWNTAFKKVGLAEDLDQNLFYALGGVPSHQVAKHIIAHYQLDADAHSVFEQKEELFLRSKHLLKIVEPVASFARRISRTHPISIASGGPREVVQETLRFVGLESLFQIVVTASDVVRGKPAPDMFLLAASKMGVNPIRCIVFEDAQPGIEAAQAAGMRYIHIKTREG